MNWLTNLFRSPTALRLATAALENCRRDQLTYAHHAEHYKGMVQVLRDREVRLQREIERLAKLPSVQSADSPAAPHSG